MNTGTTVVPLSHIGCPFDGAEELDKSLVLDRSGIISVANNVNSAATLPGQPTILLSDTARLQAFIEEDLLTSELDSISPHLWLVSTQSHSHIAALHAQIVRGRQIYLTENPELHLLWIDDRVFVKPLPPFLLSHAFWTKYLNPATSSLQDAKGAQALTRAALGYLRSWTYLVRHESDFRIAQMSGLISADVTFAQFRHFIDNFGSDFVTDHDVCSRYHFGDLRLSRLNLWSKILLQRWMFFQIRYQYWQYLAQFYGPLLFVFGILSVILSAMQVALSTNQVWQRFADVSKWFSVVVLLIIVALTVSVIALLIFVLLRELIFAARAKLRKMKKG